MKKELEDSLFERNDKILGQVDYREICIGDGWFVLVDTLCRGLQHLTDSGRSPQVRALQVKQKFGELRFYATGTDYLQAGMIHMASMISVHTCEECGAVGERVEQQGFWRTLCPDHHQKWLRDFRA